MLLKHQQIKWIGGTGIALFTLGAFAVGAHLRPKPVSGHDLYREAALPANPSASHGLILASTRTGTRIADARTPGLTGHLAINDDNDQTNPATTFQDVYGLLRRSYVDGIPDDSKMSHGAVAAMLSSLQDPATRFLEPEDFAELKRESQGQFAGIGAVLDIRMTVTPKADDDPTRDIDHPANTSYALTVVTTLPDSPAEKSGLKSGDVITDINGQWVATYDLVSAQAKELKAAQDKNDPVALNKLVQTLQKKLDTGLTLQQAQNKLSDPKEKTLTLTVSRPGAAQPMNVTVTPAPNITASGMAAKTLTGGTAYIKVGLLHATSGEEFSQKLSAFGNNIKGLIVDLRDTTGGTPENAAAIAAKLVANANLGLRLGKSLKTTPIVLTSTKTLTGPIVVLIDNGTEGPAELLASALKTSGAKLVGSNTFGDDQDVRIITLPDGAGFTLTVGRLLTASGAQFGGSGIAPDIAVPNAESGDAALSRAEIEISGRVAQR